MDLGDVVIILAPSLGAGVLLGMFLPPCALCGVCALTLLGVGAACLVLR